MLGLKRGGDQLGAYGLGQVVQIEDVALRDQLGVCGASHLLDAFDTCVGRTHHAHDTRFVGRDGEVNAQRVLLAQGLKVLSDGLPVLNAHVIAQGPVRMHTTARRSQPWLAQLTQTAVGQELNQRRNRFFGRWVLAWLYVALSVGDVKLVVAVDVDEE